MNRFWKRNYVLHEGNPLMEITTREIGDIPGCTLAPRDSIYRPQSLAAVQASNSLRADRFAIALDTDQYGPSFRGREFNEPMFGAYGEKL